MKRMVVITALVALTGCTSGEVRDTLGMNRTAPDEFKVVSRPPLSVPPEFHLRPPEPGAPARGMLSGERAGEKLLLKDAGAAQTVDELQESSVDTAVTPVLSSPLQSTGEAKFLSNAGAESADPAIRQLLNQDAETLPALEEDVSPLESWLGVEGSDPIVDPAAEAERIRDNKEAGKPVTEGETPVVDPKKKSMIDRLLD